ncbi:YchJ family protein [Pseudidiomarina sp.]|uniref:YchJ family protein n=1 Tax=Pseudidiomarina sp. TaxID=2081707 RepID=UPI003A96C1E9
MTKPVSKKCPCGGGKYAKCCEPFHAGTKHARTPEELMRSRYSAYARGREQYLRDTWHASSLPSDFNLADDNPTWLQLQILATGTHGNRGYVHFKAYFQIDDDIGVMEEQSHFVRENGRWYYLDGEGVE